MSNKTFFIIIGVILLAFVGWILLSNDGSDNGGNGNGGEQPQQNEDGLSQNTFGSTPEGKQEIRIREAYSLGCPACASYHTSLKQLREEYKDRVIFQVLHLPLTNRFPNARTGHRAVEAAGLQGADKFWAMHDKLFEERELWVYPNPDPLAQIRVFAEEVGLDVEQFNQDFNNSEINQIINADEQFWIDLEVDTTPTFIINGEIIPDTDKGKLFRPETGRQFLDELIAEIDGQQSSGEQSVEEVQQLADINALRAQILEHQSNNQGQLASTAQASTIVGGSQWLFYDPTQEDVEFVGTDAADLSGEKWVWGEYAQAVAQLRPNEDVFHVILGAECTPDGQESLLAAASDGGSFAVTYKLPGKEEFGCQ